MIKLLSCLLVLGAAVLLLPPASRAQQAPASATAPHPAPARGAAPSAWRNVPAGNAAEPRAAAPPLSRQDREAYENCPNPRRYGPKARAKKLVRIR